MTQSDIASNAFSSVLEYDTQSVEAKWQRFWETHGTNTTNLFSEKAPFYNLMMFPYPSADGLHIGNIYAFTGADIHGRFQRLRGYNVFEPIGFDAFGINAENFAIKTGVHPAKLIPINIENFSRQLVSMGMMYDWSRAVDTTRPDYYRWTQWIFIQLFKAGLVEHRKGPVNWCPVDRTVLSNEQVEDGKCERCGTQVETRDLAQWFVRITSYAERLLADLDEDGLDWSPSTKLIQKNWIGRSTGAEIVFPVNGSNQTITIFTTRPETIFGVSYLALAPENPLIANLISVDQADAVTDLVDMVRKQDIVSRRKAQSGEEILGLKLMQTARNPLNGAEIPIYIADYVLMETGTGAIMGVPAHDERDFRFARMHDLEISPVILGADNLLDAAYTQISETDVMVNSAFLDGLSPGGARTLVIEKLESSRHGRARTTYRLKDWCISRQRYWGPPIPIIYCDDCGAQPVPEEDLPVLLPELEEFQTKTDGISPLATSKEFVFAPCPQCGKVGRREVDVSDTFLDSAWYFLRYPSTDVKSAPFEPLVTRKWLPVDMYIGGQEHAVLHLMYARFITMALNDLGYIDFKEPFTRFRRHGIIVRDGQKMSKSKGNVIGPGAYLQKFGADALRCYLMFMGPFSEGGDFSDGGINGIVRFLRRLWSQIQLAVGDASQTLDRGELAKLHRCIRQVTQDTEELRYNTALAALMELCSSIKSRVSPMTKDEARAIIVMLAPFAPHFAEEAWAHMGGEPSLFDKAQWPVFEQSLCEEDLVELVVQVNGKRRGSVKVPRGSSESKVMDHINEHDSVFKLSQIAPLKRVVFVENRIINFVV